jgi:hypothetical protein
MKFMKKRKILFKRPIILGIAGIIVLGAFGSVGALNGWFGGGGPIPEDTFTRGLVGYWSFDERQGTTAADASGSGNHGTLYGPSWTTGKHGSAIQFDGSDDYVGIPYDSSLQPTEQISVEAWIKPSSLSGDQTVVSTKESGGYAIVINDIHSDKIWWSIKTGGSYRDLQVDTSSLTVNTWNHLMGIYDGNKTYFYINGNLEESSEKTGIINYDYQNSLFIGAEAGSGDSPAGNYLSFNGSIDDVRIYNRALSAAEVRYHYNRGGPVAHWKFDEGSGSTAYDSTGNNNDGTLYGEMATSTDSDSGWTTGKHGTALSFDGVDDYVRANASLSSQEMTACGWVKQTASWSEKKGFIQGNGYNLHLWVNSNGTFNYGAWTTDNNEEYSSVRVYDLYSWTFACVVNKGTSYTKLYVNGVYEEQHPLVGELRTISFFEFGRHPNHDQDYINGLIDDVRIYDYARTADEIKLDYNAGFAARFGPQTDCDRDPAGCLDKGLVGYWSFDERSGTTAADNSGNGNNGTLTNGPTWTTGVKPLSGGVSGGSALQFDGSDDYVVVLDDDSLDILDRITIEAWFKLNDYASVDVQTIAMKWEPQNFAYRWTGALPYIWFELRGTDEATRALYSENIVGSWAIANNTWYHAVGTYDGEYMRVYINGELYQEEYEGGFIIKQTTENLVFGQETWLSGDRPFDGAIDEVRIYNRALSAEEVRYHYNRGGPVAHWKFDEGSGNIAYDSTNNNNDGTFVSSPQWVTGKFGSALSFDGVDDYIDTNANIPGALSAMSVSAWIYGKNWTNPANSPILGKQYDGSEYDCSLWVMSGGELFFVVANSAGDGGQESYTTSDMNLEVDRWYHIVVTWDTADGDYKFYRDGTLIEVAEGDRYETKNVNSENLYIGTGYLAPGAEDNFNGYIDELKIYNYAITPEQILQDYNAGLSTYFK